MSEQSSNGTGFLAEVCRDWEREADRAIDLGLRVVKLRFGVVLGKDGGALASILPVFRLGLGGRLGSGKQWMSWIDVNDAVRMIKWAAVESEVSGAVNSVSPQPVRNTEFTKALGKALKKPAFLQVPGALLRMGLGEMSDAALSSEKVIARKAKDEGFTWNCPTLELALASL